MRTVTSLLFLGLMLVISCGGEPDRSPGIQTWTTPLKDPNLLNDPSGGNLAGWTQTFHITSGVLSMTYAANHAADYTMPVSGTFTISLPSGYYPVLQLDRSHASEWGGTGSTPCKTWLGANRNGLGADDVIGGHDAVPIVAYQSYFTTYPYLGGCMDKACTGGTNHIPYTGCLVEGTGANLDSRITTRTDGNYNYDESWWIAPLKPGVGCSASDLDACAVTEYGSGTVGSPGGYTWQIWETAYPTWTGR